jgi:dUTP pyrophosphatase
MPMTTMVYHKERIAQIIIVPYLNEGVTIVSDLEDTERGDGGFGSSGK